jgi:hypothetical protein
MYDGSNNPTEWLEVYQLAIEAVGEDSHVMTNYLLICLSSSAGTWLMGLHTGPGQCRTKERRVVPEIHPAFLQ